MSLTASSRNSFVYIALGILSMLTPPYQSYTLTLVSTKTSIGHFDPFGADLPGYKTQTEI
ncbi:MAG: hypothetical protein M0022_03130, partial [Desulfobacteraceae bacterium]|nr:hypothetical protein [Desulfobacteraceae bacterium]